MKKVNIIVICLLIFSMGSVEKSEIYDVNGKGVIQVTMDKEYDITFVLDLERGRGYIDGAYDLGIDMTKYNQMGALYLCNDGSNIYFVSDINLKSVFNGEMPEMRMDSEFLTTEKESFVTAEFFIDEEIPEVDEIALHMELGDRMKIGGNAVFTYENEMMDITSLEVNLRKDSGTLIIDLTGKIKVEGFGAGFLTGSMLESLLKMEYNLDATVREVAYDDGYLSLDLSVMATRDDLGEAGEILDFLHSGELEIKSESGRYDLSCELVVNPDAYFELMEEYAGEVPEMGYSYEEMIREFRLIEESGPSFVMDLDLDFTDAIRGAMTADCDNFDAYYKKAKEEGVHLPLNKGKLGMEIGEDLKSKIAVRWESQSNVEISGELRD